MRKVSVIGAGNVGSTIALLLAQDELSDVLLVDIMEGMPQGKALDIWQGGSVRDYDSMVIGTNDLKEIKGSELVIVTAGLARQPGMSREDLLKKNAQIIRGISEKIAEFAQEAIIIMVTNPLDIMTYLAWKTSGLPAQRVLGQAGVLDAARFKYFIALELNVSIEDISTMVLGGHGDSMLPLVRYTSVSGIPLTELMNEQTINRLVERTRYGGGEIVNLLKAGSAFYAPAISTVAMAESILKDKKRILPCSAYLNGQYGLSDIYIGVPVKLSSNGVEEIIELKLQPQELEALSQSARIYQEGIKEVFRIVGE